MAIDEVTTLALTVGNAISCTGPTNEFERGNKVNHACIVIFFWFQISQSDQFLQVTSFVPSLS